jgi:hypothetical protein
LNKELKLPILLNSNVLEEFLDLCEVDVEQSAALVGINLSGGRLIQPLTNFFANLSI